MKLILSTLIILFAQTVSAQNYKVTLQAPDYKEGTAYLIYYYGKNMNVQDSAAMSSKGIAVFQNKEKLLPGVYSVVMPGKNKFYDFLVDKEQLIEIKIDTTDLINKSVVKGSKENILFEKYQKVATEKGALLQKELNAFNASATKSDSVLHEANYNKINAELNQYREQIVKDNPNSMLAVLFAGIKTDSKPLIANPKTRQDSISNYQNYKKHYWDGVTFMDDRVIRSPFFLPKLEKYFREVVSPAPDSTIKDADYLLLLARSSPEMYKFLLNWLTDEYINPKYMGQDAVFVHLFEKYHSKGLSPWLNEKQLTTISNRAYMLMSNLVGDAAANLELITTSDVKMPLYSVSSPYTVVVFWDPTCGHCQTELPIMDSLYNAKWKKDGVKIYAVLTETREKENWNEFIKKHHLENWINVYESEAQKKANEDAKRPSYKQLYDVTQTPTIFLLDADKRIIAKKLTLEQIDDMINAKIKTVSNSELPTQ
ncbi:MAG: thioredoxin-like domain-containing protein [Ginsengibacter sp.]